jgi:hypothetical protein
VLSSHGAATAASAAEKAPYSRLLRCQACALSKGGKLKLYQFNTMTAKHYFCSNCGIYTHHQRRINPNECGYNVGCLERVNPFDLGQVPALDGVHHPLDRGP